MGIKGYSYGQSVQISMFSKMDTVLHSVLAGTGNTGE